MSWDVISPFLCCGQDNVSASISQYNLSFCFLDFFLFIFMEKEIHNKASNNVEHKPILAMLGVIIKLSLLQSITAYYVNMIF